MSKPYNKKVFNITIANTAAVSQAFKIMKWASFIGVLLPALTAGDVGMEISPDGSNWYPLLDITDGSDLVVCTSGNDPGWVDISDFVRFVNYDMHVRFTCAAQGALRTLTIAQRG